MTGPGSILLWAALASAGPVGGGGAYRTLETQNFRIHYPAQGLMDSEDTAHRVAHAAEVLWLRLSDETGFFPRERLHVVLVDDAEGRVGYALSAQDLVVLSAHPGVQHPRFRGASDPVWDVLAHELGHVWNQKAASGLSERVGGLEIGGLYEGAGVALGARAAWGPGRPLAWTEGAAEWLSERVGVNRWTASRRMTLRAALEADRLLSWPELQTARLDRTQVRGELAYQQGYAFARWLDERSGPGTVDAIGRRMAGGLHVGLDRAIRQVTGRKAPALYAEHLEWLRAELALDTEEAPKATDAVPGDLSGASERGARQSWSLAPRRSAVGRWRGEARGGGVWVAPAEADLGMRSTWIPTSYGHGFDFIGEHSVVVVASRSRVRGPGLRPEGIGDRWDRLWVVSLPEPGEASESRLRRVEIPGTKRARDPAVSPEGERVAWLRYRGGTTDLMVSTLDGSSHRALSGLSDGTWMQGPNWSPDGQRLVVAVHRHHQINLWTVEVQSGEWRPLTADQHDVIDPYWASDGIYFASDLNGLWDLYRLHPDTGAAWRLSATRTGLASPFPTQEGLLYSRFTDGGWRTEELPRERWLQEPISGIDGFSWVSPKDARVERFDVEPLQAASRPGRPYRAWQNLAAWQLRPVLRVDGSRAGPRVLAGGAIELADVRRVHSLSGIGLVGDDRLLRGAWTWRPGRINLGLSASHEHTQAPVGSISWRARRLDQAQARAQWTLHGGLSLVATGRLLRGADPENEQVVRGQRASIGFEFGEPRSLSAVDAEGARGELAVLLGRSSVRGVEPGLSGSYGWASTRGRVQALVPVGRGLPGSLHRLEFRAGGLWTSRALHPLELPHIGGDHPYAWRPGVVESSWAFPGYAPYALGGEALAVGTLGWRLPLGGVVGRRLGPVLLDRFEGRFAVDAGQVWRIDGARRMAPASDAGLLADGWVELRAAASITERPFDTFVRVAMPFVPLESSGSEGQQGALALRLYLGIGTGW